MEKYYTNRKGIVIIFGIILIGWIVSSYFEATNTQVLINASLGMTCLIGIIVLLSTVFSYVSVSGTTLRFRYILFIRKSVDINSILEIKDSSTYKVAKSQFRSLYILYKNQNGDLGHMELKITIFPEKTLGKLVKQLKKINPKIELSKYAERLMLATNTANY